MNSLIYLYVDTRTQTFLLYSIPLNYLLILESRKMKIVYFTGSCYDVMCAEFRHGLPLLLVGFILRSVVLALEYIHKMGYIHR